MTWTLFNVAVFTTACVLYLISMRRSDPHINPSRRAQIYTAACLVWSIGWALRLVHFAQFQDAFKVMGAVGLIMAGMIVVSQMSAHHPNSTF